jgi:hypothetical protein
MGTTNNFAIPYPEVTDYVTDGATAMETIAEYADSALQANYASPVLINGGMEIWQRGTASANATTTYNTNTSYRADRWYVLPAGATVTMQQSTTVPTNNLSRYSLLVTGATSATTVKIGQRVEAANIPQIRRRVTFAAWIYNETGASFQPDLLIGTPSASDNFTTVNNRLTQQLIPCANNEWTEISYTVDISGYTDLVNGLQVEIQIPSGSMNANTKKVYVTQVRLTPSEYVVPFQRLGVDAELARCMRYYWRLTSTTQWRIPFSFQRQAASAANGSLWNPIPMRAAAHSLDYSGLAVTDSVTFTSGTGTWAIDGAYANPFSTSLVITGSSGISAYGNALVLNTSGSFIALNAEL